MQAVKNWCDGERVKKLGTLRQTKQGAGLSTSGLSGLRTNYVSDNGWVWSWNRIRWNRQKTISSSTTSSIISTLKICRPRGSASVGVGVGEHTKYGCYATVLLCCLTDVVWCSQSHRIGSEIYRQTPARLWRRLVRSPPKGQNTRHSPK
jgi:hypothetical protein